MAGVALILVFLATVALGGSEVPSCVHYLVVNVFTYGVVHGCGAASDG